MRWKVWIGDGLEDCGGRSLEELGGEGGSIRDDIVDNVSEMGGRDLESRVWTFQVEVHLAQADLSAISYEDRFFIQVPSC